MDEKVHLFFCFCFCCWLGPGNDRWVRLSQPVVWKKKNCEMIEQLFVIGWLEGEGDNNDDKQ